MSEKKPKFYSINQIWLYITDPKITNLVGLPTELPEIKNLEINGRKINSQISVQMNFRSFKGLPATLPKLESIEIFDSNIQNFESLTAEMPSLKEMWFQNCHIHNFKGIPKNPINFSILDCKIDSFEGLELNNLDMFDNPDSLYIFDNPQPNICLGEKTEFYSLHGIDRTTLQSILIEYFSRFINFYNPAKLTTKGLELLNNCVNRQIYRDLCPLEFVRRYLPRIAPADYFDEINTIDYRIKHNYDHFNIGGWISTLNERGYDYYHNLDWNFDKDPAGEGVILWIYCNNLEEKLFIPEKIDRLLAFYEKSPTELALQYRSDPKSLPKDQIDRLIHEADHQTLQILENDEFSTLQKDDAVITQISHKYAVKTENGKVFL